MINECQLWMKKGPVRILLNGSRKGILSHFAPNTLQDDLNFTEKKVTKSRIANLLNCP